MSHSLTQEWRSFRHDPPGERFANHHERMRQHGTRAGAIVRLALGVLLSIAGIVLLFIPGPGLLVILFGVGLLGGESRVIARTLDRVEPAMRRAGKRAKKWWATRATFTQDALIACAIVTVGATAYLVWSWWTA